MSERAFRIEVRARAGLADAEGARVLAAARELGIAGVTGVRSARVTELSGALSLDDARRISLEALTDPVVEAHDVADAALPPAPPGGAALTLTVLRRAGVMDPAQASLRKALHDLGLSPLVRRVRLARRYDLEGAVSDAERALLERRVLSNAIVEEVVRGVVPLPPAPEPRARAPRRQELALEDLPRLNKELGLSLSPLELDAIAARFRDVERRLPTDVELETIAQTWSEHCKHKTLAGAVRYVGPLGSWQDPGAAHGERRYRNMLKETIFRATTELAREWCLSVFKDNAGVIAFDDTVGACMKVETHNHPSALEPYGGAGTGVGGVVRDILGTGLGARPIANTDVFCFAPPDTDPARVPEGSLHPRRVLRGVVAGVRDYGNRMGIPTVSGAIIFDPRYVANPLVFCGTVGVIPRDRIAKAPHPGDVIVVAGGRTGRDGIHGATFSSAELDTQSETTSSGAVQIGNPIEEKRVQDVLLPARDRGLFRAVTDCGAGGLSSAVGEMAAETGASVDLSLVPLKYDGLTPAEVWISEAQERMVFAVPPARKDELLALFAAEDVEATAIGRFTDTGRLEIHWGALAVGELSLGFLHDGLPRVERSARFAPRDGARAEPLPEAAYAPAGPDGGYEEDLLAILRSWSVCSKERVVRQYDHEVQGASVVKPFTGAADDGPSDAAVLAPVPGSRRALAISCGVNPLYGDVDPYRMGAAAVDEAIRNAVAVGADPDRCAILDNFAWGDCRLEDRLGALVQAAEGATAAALALGAPFISGKDSLNNEYQTPAGRLAIPGTLLVSCLGIVPDKARVATMDLKRAGDLVFLVGATREELGGSHLHLVRGLSGGLAPRLHGAEALATYRALHGAIRDGLVRACHDLSEGGLAVAAAEMALAGRLGIELTLPAGPLSTAAALFSESCGRFLIEARPEAAEEIGRRFHKSNLTLVGRVTAELRVRVIAASGRECVSLAVDAALAAWSGPLAPNL